MTSSSPLLSAQVRAQIAAFLPRALAKAVESYRAHMDKSIEDKKFSEHHKDAKVAIGHIELLIKLAKWAELPTGAASQGPALEMLLFEAQKELEQAGEEEDS
ncbi:MAG: hypothetical protein WC043_10815 [Pseudobdellovibrionaceae bacterium]